MRAHHRVSNIIIKLKESRKEVPPIKAQFPQFTAEQ